MSLVDRIDRTLPPMTTRDRLDRVRVREPAAPVDEQLLATAAAPPGSPQQRAVVRRELEHAVRELLGAAPASSLSPEDLTEMVNGVAAELRPRFDSGIAQRDWARLVELLPEGLSEAGPLGPLLADPELVEIMINGPDLVFLEHVDGRIEQWSEVFCDEEELILTVNSMLAQTGRRLTPSSPLVDGRLVDGSRLHAVHNVLSPQGTCVTIRKFRQMLDLNALLRNGTLEARMARFLKACVLSRRNLLVCGGTGTGKTTLLNVLLELAPKQERLVAVEAVTEINFTQVNAINLEARPASVEGTGAVGQRELVQNALRMRPDRIIVGEVRGGEALDLLQAMNTGHPGSMGTVHANSPRDALRRMQTLTLLSGVELPLSFVARLVSEALNFVIHLIRDASGARRIGAIEEVLQVEGDTILTQPLFQWEPEPNHVRGGRHKCTGIPPRCLADLKAVDPLPEDFFTQDQ